MYMYSTYAHVVPLCCVPYAFMYIIIVPAQVLKHSYISFLLLQRGILVASAFCSLQCPCRLGVPEQSLCGTPLGVGIVVEVQFSCTCRYIIIVCWCRYMVYLRRKMGAFATQIAH